MMVQPIGSKIVKLCLKIVEDEGNLLSTIKIVAKVLSEINWINFNFVWQFRKITWGEIMIDFKIYNSLKVFCKE